MTDKQIEYNKKIVANVNHLLKVGKERPFTASEKIVINAIRKEIHCSKPLPEDDFEYLQMASVILPLFEKHKKRDVDNADF